MTHQIAKRVGVIMTATTWALLLTCASPVFAETSSTQTPTVSTKKQEKQEQNTDRAKTKAVAEINRRITSLNGLIALIGAMKHLSESDKNALIADAQAQITNLASLKTKIQADTDPATLRTDRQSIFTQYRIYLLFLPKTRILAAADRMGEIVDLMTQTAAKLQTAIDAAKTAGKDVASLQAALTSAQAKIEDAKLAYTNAENAVKTLVPDGGDEGKAQSNKAALQNAHTMIKTGAQDLKTASQNFKTIREGLRSLGFKPTPKPTTTP